MLQLQNVQKAFHLNTQNELMLFSDLNLTIKQGEFIVILGSNGSGKSTLLNLIDGQLAVDGGRVIFRDDDITHTPSFQRKQNISRVFQDPALGSSPSLTILQNMSLALNKGKPFNLRQGVNREQREPIHRLVGSLGLNLEEKLDVPVSLLSGGQRQALGLLMAVCSKPKLLLLDEHTAALDPKSSQHIMRLTQQLIKDFAMTTLMITHQIKDALEYGDRCIMLHEGKVVLDVKDKEKQALQTQELLSLFHLLSL
jgi:putative tryptophan/tyrosine transport system ATP-binding protein